EGSEHVRSVGSVLLDASGNGLVQAPLPHLESRDARGIGHVALVGEVGGHSRKRVDGGYVRARGLRQQSRGNGKILVVAGRQALAGGIGGGAHHSVSGTPARALTTRAITNSRSDRRLR